MMLLNISSELYILPIMISDDAPKSYKCCVNTAYYIFFTLVIILKYYED